MFARVRLRVSLVRNKEEAAEAAAAEEEEGKEEGKEGKEGGGSLWGSAKGACGKTLGCQTGARSHHQSHIISLLSRAPAGGCVCARAISRHGAQDSRESSAQMKSSSTIYTQSKGAD